eukprot:GEMP01044739.1.p1 GENE.GEMP01044739.1~~GEMP01044739.1.p1  ORF type:complete len:256 (+),score=62.69 GEMP01044739.1:141-908(+)
MLASRKTLANGTLYATSNQVIGKLAHAIRLESANGAVNIEAIGPKSAINAVKAVVLANAFAQKDKEKTLLAFSPVFKQKEEKKYLSLTLTPVEYEKVANLEEVLQELQPRVKDQRIFLRDTFEVMQVSTADGDVIPPFDFQTLRYPISVTANQSAGAIYVGASMKTTLLTRLIFTRWKEVEDGVDLHTVSVGLENNCHALRALAMVLNDIDGRILKGDVADPKWASLRRFVVLPQMVLKKSAINETHMLRLDLIS